MEGPQLEGLHVVATLCGSDFMWERLHVGATLVAIPYQSRLKSLLQEALPLPLFRRAAQDLRFRSRSRNSRFYVPTL